MTLSVVLCAIDTNRPEEETHVLQAAQRLAAMDGAQLDVITVVPDFGATVVGAYFQDHHVRSARDGAAKALSDFAEKVLGAEANAKIRHIVAVGSVYEEVLKAAKVSEADLIVIGAHRPDLKDYLLGPNAARVVRHSDCSVYVVR
ncbi:universal stress protein [Primorskyibacter aestuariivivens]|uniref:universal stress protein n=1 Tax=Primorskyibacter aestuariivivens TaxID=1888912 RepID=UPI002300BF97|nr:universal stress protein [Primorskyibacter aestuariivivens]MDA7428033.1 universal stress protein [Primorskyibacter aestuariivivens]